MTNTGMEQKVMAEHMTISEAIGADHRMFDVLFEKIKGTNDEAEQVQWRNQLVWTVARHAISEELTMYPAMEKYMGEEGVKLAKTDKEQHQGVKQYLFEIQDMTPTDPRFWPKFETLMDLLHHHVDHEKDEDMPRLEKILPEGESQKLARSFEKTKGIVPTRSHPAAPTEYYAENIAGLFAAPIDRLTQWLQDFPDKDAVRSAEQEAESKL